MRNLVALFCPPLPLLACGRSHQAIVNLILCLVGLATARSGQGVIALNGSDDVGDQRGRR